MSDYYSMSSSPVNNNISFLSFSASDRDDDQESPTAAAAMPRYYNRRSSEIVGSAVQPQSRCVDENNQKSLIWNISLIDDQDEVSERFLKMHFNNDPKKEVDKFGPSILTVPKNIRKQADEIFKSTAETNPNEIFEYVSTKVSWILPASYQQYLKSIPSNVLENKERHVLYPWTQWNKSTGMMHRSFPSSINASPAASDRSFQSSPLSSSSSMYANATCGTSPDSSRSSSYSQSNNYNNFYGENGVGMVVVKTMVADGSFTRDDPHLQAFTPSKQRFNDRDQQKQLMQTMVSHGVPPSAFSRSSSSANNLLQHNMDHRPLPKLQSTYVGSGVPAVRYPSRLYYCVNNENHTINKLVEHYCTFCFKNKEPPEVFGSHLVRDATRTTCPKLRALRCKHCNATGDNAHTIKYCPFFYANYG